MIFMKRAFIRNRDNRKRRYSIKVFSLILIISLLIFFSRDVSNYSLRVASLLQPTFWEISDSIYEWATSIFNSGDLKRQNISLLNENSRLSAEIIGLKELRNENKTLRNALDIEMNREFSIKVATVTGVNILEDVIIINRGSDDGILKGMPVITENRILVGKILKTFNNFSRVMLTTNRESVFDAEIQKEGFMGLVNGSGNLSSEIRLLPKGVDIREGSPIVTVSLGGIFPQGLFIGTIYDVRNDETNSFQLANIKPYYNIRRDRKVFIITDLR